MPKVKLAELIERESGRLEAERVSDAIKRQLRRQHMTQSGLARRMGISPQTLSKRLIDGTLRLNELAQIAEETGTVICIGGNKE